MRIRNGANGFRGAAARAEPTADLLPFIRSQITQATDEIDRAEQGQAQQEEASDPTGNRAANEPATPPAVPPGERGETNLPCQGKILNQAEEPERHAGVGALLH